MRRLDQIQGLPFTIRVMQSGRASDDPIGHLVNQGAKPTRADGSGKGRRAFCGASVYVGVSRDDNPRVCDKCAKAHEADGTFEKMRRRGWTR